MTICSGDPRKSPLVSNVSNQTLPRRGDKSQTLQSGSSNREWKQSARHEIDDESPCRPHEKLIKEFLSDHIDECLSGIFTAVSQNDFADVSTQGQKTAETYLD